MDDAPFEIEPGHIGQDHVDVLALAQNVPQHRGDGAGREDAGGHLVQQRLEEVVVAPVDERDVDVGRSEQTGRGQAAKPAATVSSGIPVPCDHAFPASPIHPDNPAIRGRRGKVGEQAPIPGRLRGKRRGR